MRHLEAITMNVAKTARLKVTSTWGASGRVIVEGLPDDQWMCLDMGNIVVHIMSDSIRREYDIESRYRQFQVLEINCLNRSRMYQIMPTNKPNTELYAKKASLLCF